MATETANYGLVQPAENDYYDIGVQNGNMEKIDEALKSNADAMTADAEDVAELAGTGRTTETVMGAYTAAENRIGPSVTTPGNPVTASTKATDIAVVNLKGAMQITKPAPEADTSPDNIATITGIVSPTITATSGGQSNSQQISGELYSLPNGTKDEYDGQAGKLAKRVGELVLTGTETMRLQENRVIITISPIRVISASNKGYCTHFAVTNGGAYLNTQIGQISWQAQGNITIGNFGTWADADAVKAYLSAQAAAGTPVTIYYEMTVPQTTEVSHGLACYAASTTFACADPLATDMSVTVLDGRMVGRSRDAELLAGLHPSTYRQSNRNLIDNGDFRSGCVVNQRGQASYTGAGILTIDRWTQWDDGTLALSDDGVLLSKGPGKDYTAITYALPNATASGLHGQTVTFSVETGGAIYTNTGVFNRNSLLPLGPAGIPGTTAYFDIIAFTIGGNPMIRVLNPGDPLLISRVKLELGPVSTLALDPPADYGETLLKCQQYYWQPKNDVQYSWVAAGYVFSSTQAAFYLRYPRAMRAIPTVTISGPATSYEPGWGNQYGTLSPEFVTTDSCCLLFTLSEGTFVNGVGTYLKLFADTGYTIQVSAEL